MLSKTKLANKRYKHNKKRAIKQRQEKERAMLQKKLRTGQRRVIHIPTDEPAEIIKKPK